MAAGSVLPALAPSQGRSSGSVLSRTPASLVKCLQNEFYSAGCWRDCEPWEGHGPHPPDFPPYPSSSG
ncbi:hypothetical protein VULLAG_LOCUS10860 [Vulpes lagopus]